MRLLEWSAACPNLSRFDPASLAILDRVNYAIQLLEAPSVTRGVPTPATQRPDDTSFRVENAEVSIAQPDASWIGTPSGAASTGIDQDETSTAALVDVLNVTAKCACTYLLDWPVLRGHIASNSVQPRIRTAAGNRRSIPSVTTSGSAINEGNSVTLVEAFLRNVHTKNPILDPTELRGLARTAAEDGFIWDGSSCLILITSALGALSTPWDMKIPAGSETSQDHPEAYTLSRSYYLAACKRLALLEPSILSSQCWFLTAVYEMYAMKPMYAWLSFSRACSLLQLHLHTGLHDTENQFTRAEQCLYWSCLKSECEMREELDLPPTGLAMLGYPGIFPSPPTQTTSIPAATADDHNAWDYVFEQSWYYYLSDTAYRRIANRTSAALYSVPKEQWSSMGVRRLLRICGELAAQTEQWWKLIPGSPASSLRGEADELTYMLRLNYVDLVEKIWRPVLYVAIHDEVPAADTSAVNVASAKCLDMCFELLEGGRLKHRHHGCWLTIRCMFSTALVILAAVKSRKVDVRSDWAWFIHVFQSYLRYWEQECPDLEAMRTGLANLLNIVGE